MPSNYNSIQQEYKAYLNLWETHDPGTDGSLIDILEAAREMEKDDLSVYGLSQAFTTRPPGVGAKPPFIVHIPAEAEFEPVSTLADGYAGIEMEVRYHVDIFIAGGHLQVPFHLAMITAYSILIQLCMLLAHNPTVKGTCRGVEFGGVSPQGLPFVEEKTTVTWQGISLHVVFITMYQWRAI